MRQILRPPSKLVSGPQPTHGVLTEYQPRSREEQQLIQALSDRIQHAFVVAAAQPLDSRLPAKGYLKVAQKFFRRQSPDRRAVARRRAEALLKAPIGVRRNQFGALADQGTDLNRLTRQADPVLSKLVSQVVRGKLHEREDLTKLAGAISKAARPRRRPSGIKLGPGYSKLAFRINSVKCREETDEVGADEILLSGFATSPTGKRIDIPQWKVSDDFDQGEKVVYYLPFHKAFDLNDPYRGKGLATLDLYEPGKVIFPGTWSVTLVMGEEDKGGFGDIVEDIWEAIKDDLIDFAAQEFGEAIGGFFGAVIGVALAVALAALIGIFVELFDNPDDLVAYKTWELTLLSLFKTYFDGLTPAAVTTPDNVWMSPLKQLAFVGDGGRYDVTMHWRVSV